MSTNTENFERLWDKFFVGLKGRIMKKAKNQELTYPLMKLILSDAKSDWETEYEECGRWLIGYMQENPAKGRIVREILTDNMSFKEVHKKPDSLGVAGVLAPLAGAALGFGVSSLFGAGIVVKIVSAVVPAGLSFGAVKAIEPKMKEKSLSDLIDGYLSQLEKYKNSVLSVLSD